MIFALILATLVLTGNVRIGYVMVIAGLFGMVNAFDIPGRHTFYFDLVGRDDLVSAVALNSVSFNATRVVGPAIAGMVLGVAGAGVCFLINGISYLAVLWGLFQMRLPPPPPSRVAAGSALRNIMAGLRHIGRDRRMRTLVLVSALLTIFGSPFLVLLPIVAKQVLGRGAAAYGWMMAAVGLGALFGAIWVGGPGRRMGRGRIIGWTATLFGTLVTSLAFARAMPLVLILLTLIGFAMISSGAIVNTLLQVLAPDELRGRVVSVYTLVAVGFAPIGAVQAGAIAERWGAPVALGIGGTICVLGTLTALWRTPELKTTR